MKHIATPELKSNNLRLGSPIIQKPFQSKSATSAVARLSLQCHVMCPHFSPNGERRLKGVIPTYNSRDLYSNICTGKTPMASRQSHGWAVRQSGSVPDRHNHCFGRDGRATAIIVARLPDCLEQLPEKPDAELLVRLFLVGDDIHH